MNVDGEPQAHPTEKCQGVLWELQPELIAHRGLRGAL